MRTRRLVTLLLTLTVALAGACGSSVVDPPAAEVNGRKITQATLDSELDAMTSNTKYLEFLESQGNEVKDKTNKTYDLQFVARVLTRQIYLELIHQEFLRRKLKPVSNDDREKMRATVEGEVGGPEVFAAFPAEYRRRLLTRNVEVQRVQLALSGTEIDDAAIAEYYEENASAFVETCSRHILFAAVNDAGEVDTEATAAQSAALQAEAVAAKKRIDAGEDFATLAMQLSKDASNRDQGGDLQCGGAGRFVPEFETALDALQPGQVSEPVQTQFGWHLMKVDSRSPRALEDVVDEIEAALMGQAQEGFGAFLREQLTSAKISVNPRFGTFEAEGENPGVVPPSTPSTPDVGGPSSEGGPEEDAPINLGG